MVYTIKDLKEIIADLPDDMEIVVSSDAEGNSFAPLVDHSFGHLAKYPDGEVGFEAYEDEDGEVEVSKEDATAILLWP